MDGARRKGKCRHCCLGGKNEERQKKGGMRRETGDEI